jgi:hypothetical protein
MPMRALAAAKLSAKEARDAIATHGMRKRG